MKTRGSRQLKVLRSCLVLFVIALAPVWAQDNKHDSGHDQQNAPEAQHQKSEKGTRPSGGGEKSNKENKPRETRNERPTREMNKPPSGRGERSPQEGGNKPASGESGQNRPAQTNGGNKAQGGHNKPTPTTGENKQGGQNRPTPTTSENKQGGRNRPVTTARKFTPPQGATAKPNSHGGKEYVGKNGTQFNTGKNGNLTTVKTKNGTVARFDQSGRVARIHTNRVTVNQGPRGGRVAVIRLPNGGRAVSMGGRRGYVERPFMRGGRPYMNRTYVYGGRSHVVVYRGYYWHGHPYYRYVPPYYYRRPFYVWCYHPWPAPIYWGWGWGAAPWYGYYGYYFAPYPRYPSAAFWLTDFIIAANLQAAYQAQADANAQAQAQAYSGPPPAADQNVTLTPEVKQAIANEVSDQLAAQQAAAASPTSSTQAAPSGTATSDQLPDALDPKSRTFVVSDTLSETMADGTACSLSSGDVLTRISDTPDQNQNVTVLVTSGQNGDCAPGTQLSMSVQDLQDMLNDFRQNLNTGLQSLADNQGKNGMPSSPPPDPTAVPDGTAQPDPDAASQIDQADQDANQAEQEVQQSQESDDGNQ